MSLSKHPYCSVLNDAMDSAATFRYDLFGLDISLVRYSPKKRVKCRVQRCEHEGSVSENKVFCLVMCLQHLRN